MRFAFARTCRVALIVLAVPSFASAAEPRAGQRYDGKSASGQRVFLHVHDNGRRLRQWGFAARMRCGDGKRRVQGFFYRREGIVRIRNGGFSYRARPSAFRYRLKTGRVVRGTARGRVTGEFVTRNTVTGTFKTSFQSRRLDCESKRVPFRVDLDGTSRAPYRSRNVATGKYGIGSENSTGGILNVFLPARQIRSLKFDWWTDCRSGLRFHGYEYFWARLRGRRFAGDGKLRQRTREGYRVVKRYEFDGALYYNGHYNVRGHFKIRVDVYDAGKRIDVCRTGRQRYGGGFDGGPSDPAGEHPDRAP